jgi:hypothetical protein
MKASMYSKIAVASSARVFQMRRSSSSICMEPKNDSIMALSNAEATLPMEPSRPASRSRWPKSQLVYFALGPTVGMNHCAHGFAAQPGHVQGVGDQFGAQVIGDRPADNTAGVDVEHDRRVDPALTGLDSSSRRIGSGSREF